MTMLQHLFQPMRIGRMEIANRIMMPGMSAGMMLDHDSRPTPEMIAYYVERARNRPGLMAIGSAAVMPALQPRRHPIGIAEDGCIAPLKKLVDAVHRHDTKFGIQLWDGGLQTGGKLQWTPSGVGINASAVFDANRGAPVQKIPTTEEVERIVGYFADGAVRCAEAGFDFIEIHAGHGYLISNFLTPFFNRRTDRYGGSFENRSRFLIEILRQTRQRCGGGIGIGVKVNGDDFLDQDSWTVADACRLAPILEAEGADYISVTAGVMGARRLTVPPLYEKQGCFADMAAAVRKHVTIPVATVGRVKNVQMGDDMVRDGVADIICMGRAMIADADIVSKARVGNLDDIRLCLADCRGCIDNEMRGIKSGAPGSASCVVNPRMGRESVLIDVEGDKRDNPRKVLVVGGGLAGLEAARRSAFSGHQVILCESRDWIGGQIRFAAMMPGRHEIADTVPWYERQLARYGVDVRLGTEVDAGLIDAIMPDVVIVATGSVPSVPQNMTDMLYHAGVIEVLMSDDILEHALPTGQNILVIGGDQIGLQMADYLSEGGRNVVVAEADNHFAQKMAANDRWYLTARTIEKKVHRIKNVRGIGIGEDGVSLMLDKGPQALPGIDTIVFASERRSIRPVAAIARSKGIETHVVGDAADAVSADSGTIFANIAQAYDVARNI